MSRPSVTTLLVAVFTFPFVLICLLTPTAGWCFPGELACHWGMQAAFLSLPAVIVWRRQRVIAALLLVSMALGSWPVFVAAWEPRAPVVVDSPGLTSIRVTSANLNVYNEKNLRAPTVAAVLAQQPQIIALAEGVTSSDRAQFVLTTYPYQIWQPQLTRKWRDCVALISVFPIVHSVIHDLEEEPFIEATLMIDGRRLHVIAVHTQSPWNPANWRERDQQLGHIAIVVNELSQREPAPVLLMGDCNLSVASPAWSRFAAASGLLRVSQHEPSSWRSELGPFGITIDHILGRDLALGRQHAFTLPGSDHRGLSGTIGFLTPP